MWEDASKNPFNWNKPNFYRENKKIILDFIIHMHIDCWGAIFFLVLFKAWNLIIEAMGNSSVLEYL